MKTIIANLIIILILAAVVFLIARYLYKAKKRGQTCIGCPYAKQCGAKCAGGCAASGHHPSQS